MWVLQGLRGGLISPCCPSGFTPQAHGRGQGTRRRLSAAANESKEAEETVRRQALSEMAKAVEDKGMSVDRYEHIFTVAQSNGDVRRKIVERMPKNE